MDRQMKAIENKENTDNAQNKENNDNALVDESEISQLSTIVSSMKEMQHDLSKPETGEDELDVFGKDVAKQLRTLSTEQAILGQNEIITKCRPRDLKYRNMTMSSPAYSADTQASDDYAPRPSTSTSNYMPLNSPASTVETQSTNDSLNIVSNDPIKHNDEYINIITNAFNNA
ncbi:unnamed protein product [Euphydryas editha]|uniref:Uncharacterized protein n=1 Tax=Euphydryas editha TaxID=104508 RepID=A0AAU9UNI5_EUPED|nr:unnamed protein product [Euphydryas editha]